MCSLVQQESWRVTSHHYMCRGMAYDDPAAASCTTSTVAIWHGEKRPRTAHDQFPSTVLVDNKSHLLVSRCNAVVLRNSHSPHRNGFGCGELSMPHAAECPSIVPNATDDDGTNKTSPQLPPFFSTRYLATVLLWASHKKCSLRDARCDLFWFRTGAHRVTCILYTGTGLRCRASCLHEPEGLLYREKVKSGEQIFTN